MLSLSQKLLALCDLLGETVVLNAPDMNVASFERVDFEAMMMLALDQALGAAPDVIRRVDAGHGRRRIESGAVERAAFSARQAVVNP